MLIVEELSKSYSHPIFQSVSFRLEKGEILQITGANGSGKTTLLKCIASTISCNFTKLSFNSRNLKPSDSAYATNDERSFFPKLTLKENLLFFKKFYQSKINIEDWIPMLGLEQHWNSEFQICSTGIRKRLCLLRAIAKNAPILLLDEPFSNIDPESKIKIQNLFFNPDFRKDQITIFSSNNPLQNHIGLRTLAIEPVWPE